MAVIYFLLNYLHSLADTLSSLLAKNSLPVINARITSAAIPPFLPAKVIAVIIIPAATTPVKIDDTATAVGIPKRKAPIAPVHAPVPGRGIPTNKARDAHCFCTDPTPRLEDFFSARERMGPISFLHLRRLVTDESVRKKRQHHIALTSICYFSTETV
jgi:hypothetical protein